ncbi:hypothetical protein RT0499 [Rickettsia typhi str. Wilmington]|uniref:Uncharacterized protein n=1 Tax=Rickettsia typhi (strain ATCC VR-144 / Wilmington) TaxID=257363 RepID=Q68WM1_RICTY|nr:hypothetical protein RT0499 [Rickettsia typhi str. Wilmington]
MQKSVIANVHILISLLFTDQLYRYHQYLNLLHTIMHTKLFASYTSLYKNT